MAREQITLTIPQGAKEILEKLAAEHDIYCGSHPSISGLIQNIAKGNLKVSDVFLSDKDLEARNILLQALMKAFELNHDPNLFDTLVSILEDQNQADLIPWNFVSINQISKILTDLIDRQQCFYLKTDVEQYFVSHARLSGVYLEVVVGSENDVFESNKRIKLDQVKSVVPSSKSEWISNFPSMMIQTSIGDQEIFFPDDLEGAIHGDFVVDSPIAAKEYVRKKIEEMLNLY